MVPTVIVVDDGSSDGTAEEARGAGAEVIRHKTNEGKGAAIQTGFRMAIERGFEGALLMDGDGQHAAADIPKFLNETSARLVIGNRMANADGMPWLRRFVNRWMSARLSKRLGVDLPDTQCGFRLVHLVSWAKLDCVTRHFEVESEMLAAFVEAGYPVKFVPIQVIYNQETSKIAPVIDTLRWFRWWCAERANPHPGSLPLGKGEGEELLHNREAKEFLHIPEAEQVSEAEREAVSEGAARHSFSLSPLNEENPPSNPVPLEKAKGKQLFSVSSQQENRPVFSPSPLNGEGAGVRGELTQRPPSASTDHGFTSGRLNSHQRIRNAVHWKASWLLQ